MILTGMETVGGLCWCGLPIGHAGECRMFAGQRVTPMEQVDPTLAQPSLPVEAATGAMTTEYLKANRDLPIALQFVLQYSDEVWRLCQLGHLNSRSKLADITLDARAFLDDLSDKGAAPAPPADTATQDCFDLSVGRLDRVLSELVGYSRDPETDDANKQTLKHHAEDMIAAGEHILKKIGIVEGLPQPESQPPADTREPLKEVIHKDSACVVCGCSQTLPVNLQRCRCMCHPRDREPNAAHWKFDPKALAAFDYLQEIGVNGDEAREYLVNLDTRESGE
jgi:hypothetical protein